MVQHDWVHEGCIVERTNNDGFLRHHAQRTSTQRPARMATAVHMLLASMLKRPHHMRYVQLITHNSCSAPVVPEGPSVLAAALTRVSAAPAAVMMFVRWSRASSCRKQ
jgi:hypothetical protein